eukprot:m.110505 g.110505  ORF g.110505 m.110505 type:complete len:738 (+) comp15367_c0_seq1:181-2394(+)
MVALFLLALQLCSAIGARLDYPMVPYPPMNSTWATVVTPLGTINNRLWVFRPPTIYCLEQSLEGSQWHTVASASSFDTFAVSNTSLFLLRQGGQLEQLNQDGVQQSLQRNASNDNVLLSASRLLFIAGIRQSTASLEIYQPYTTLGNGASQNLSLTASIKIPTNGTIMTDVYRIAASNDADCLVVLTEATKQLVFMARHQGGISWTVSHLGQATLSRWSQITGWYAPSLWLAIQDHGANPADILLIDVSAKALVVEAIKGAREIPLSWARVTCAGFLFGVHQKSHCISGYTLTNMTWNKVLCVCYPIAIDHLHADESQLYVTFTAHGVSVINVPTLQQQPEYAVNGTCTPAPTTTFSTPITSSTGTSDSVTSAASHRTQGSATDPPPSILSTTQTSGTVSETSNTRSVQITSIDIRTSQASNAPSTPSTMISTTPTLSDVEEHADHSIVPVLLATGGAILAILCFIALLIHRHLSKQRQDRATLLGLHLQELSGDDGAKPLLEVDAPLLKANLVAGVSSPWIQVRTSLANGIPYDSQLLAGVEHDADNLDEEYRSLLSYACLYDSPRAVQDLIRYTSDRTAEALDVKGRAPIHWACAVGSIECLKALVRARPETADMLFLLTAEQQTLLHLAVLENDAKMLDALLESGQGRLRLMLLHEDTCQSETPIALAERLGYHQCEQLLRAKFNETRHDLETEKHMKRRLQVTLSMRKKAWRQRGADGFNLASDVSGGCAFMS